MMGNVGLAKELLGFWSEKEQQKCNPRSGFLKMEVLYRSRTNQGYGIRVQYRKGGAGELPGGIVTGEASWKADEDYRCNMTGMSLSALAIVMGRLEIVEEIDRLGLLSDQDIRGGIVYAGDARILEYLNRKERFHAQLWFGKGPGGYLSPCWNWFLLAWFAEQGLLTAEDCKKMRDRLGMDYPPRAGIDDPVKMPCGEEYLRRACGEALRGK